MDTFLQLVASGLTSGSVYALVGLGMGLIFAASRVVSFAQGEFVMVGALLGITLYDGLHLPYGLTILAVAAGTAALGAGMALLMLRLQGMGAPLSSLIITTVAVAFMMRAGGESIWGLDPRYSPPPLGDDVIRVFGARVFPQSVVVWVATAVLLLAVFWVLDRSRLGREFRATSANPPAAWLVGINVHRVVALAFIFSAALGGVAGFLFSPLTSSSPFMGTALSIKGFAAAMIGGLGSGQGAVLGGLTLGLAEAFAAGYGSSAYGDAVSFLILLMMLFVRPSGFLARAEGR